MCYDRRRAEACVDVETTVWNVSMSANSEYLDQRTPPFLTGSGRVSGWYK